MRNLSKTMEINKRRKGKNMFKKMFVLTRKLWEKIKFEHKMREMDRSWYFMGGNCFGLYPPSFYYRHTEEEIKQITEETLAELYAVVDKYREKYDLDKTESKDCQQGLKSRSIEKVNSTLQD